MKIAIIFLTVLLIVQFSSQNAQEVNCLWPQEITGNGDPFTISATQEALERSIVSENGSTYHCLTKVEVSSSVPLYYELELSMQNTARKDCMEGYEPREYLLINPSNASRNGIQTCLTHLDRIIIQLPLTIAFISEVIPTTGFDINFTRVSSPCFLHKVEATADHKFLFSPLYDVFISPTPISCKVFLTVPLNFVLFLQIRRNPSPTISQCNGSLTISGTSSHDQDFNELCGSGLEVMVLEPRNYAEGISFHFQRERNKRFSGFQLEYWAIKRDVRDCKNLASISLPVSSEAVSYEFQVPIKSIQGGYCDFHLDADGKAISFPFLSDVEDFQVEVYTDEGNFIQGCGRPSIKTVHAPPKKSVRIRIQPCHGSISIGSSLSSLILVAVAEDADSFPQVFYAANATKHVWIPKDLTQKPELLTFSIRAGFDNSCLLFYIRNSGSIPPLSSVANLFAGTGNTSFDFSRDCKNRAIDAVWLNSNTSSTVTVQIKRDINEGFWLAFKDKTDERCHVQETGLDASDEAAGSFFPHIQDTWRENTQCKWVLRASKDNILKYRGQNHNPASVMLTVRNATSGQLITAFPQSSTWAWYYATSDIEVYAHASTSLTIQNSFDFQFDREDFSDIETCSPTTTNVLTKSTTVYSPNYPNYSFGSSQCKWLLKQQDSNSDVFVKFTLITPLPCGSKSFFLITFDGMTQKTCDPTVVKKNYNGDVLIELVTSFDEPVPGFYFRYSFAGENCPNNLSRSQLMAASHPKSITSSGYPSCYPPNSDCFWRITASTGMKVRIVIIEVEIEFSVGCDLDGLDIFDGFSDSFPLLASICGQNIQNGARIISSSSEVYMHFYSDAGICYTGFSLTYEQIEVNNQGCSRDPLTLFAGPAPTHLESPGYPHGYSHNLQCSWIIRSSLDIVEIFLNDINLEEHVSCEFAFIEIYDGQDKNARRLARLCEPPEGFNSYKSTSDVVLIYFHSDSHARGRGFQLSIQSKTWDDPAGSDDDHSPNYSQTGAIVGGNIAATLAIFSLIVSYICILQRRRRRLSQHRRGDRQSSGTGTNSNSTRQSTSVCVINPLIINTNGRHDLSSEPPPYPGLTNCSPEIILSCEGVIAAYSREAPPEYSEVADTYEDVQPPAYSDTSAGPVSTSDDQPDSSNTAEISNSQNDQSGPEGLNDNCNDDAEYVELQDAPPEYELARQVQDEPPPAYEPRQIPARVTRLLGPL